MKDAWWFAAWALTCQAAPSGITVQPDFGAGTLKEWGRSLEVSKQRSAPPEPSGPDVLLIDAGSSGSKVFAFHPEKAEAKLLTRCREDLRKAGKTNQGIAALAYNKTECEWLIGKDTRPLDLNPLARPAPEYAHSLLWLLRETYQAATGRRDLNSVKNKHSVPMLATAGMRLISQADNDKVWGYLCGRTHAGITIAKAGERCGTAPGTTEAYYEFLANAVNGRGNRVLTGTFTIGGASAQIAIPLKTVQDVNSFEQLKQNIAAELDCTKLRLADGQLAPIFNTRREGGPQKECIDDYITFRPRSEIRVTPEVGDHSLRLTEIQGVGLISFLGLKGSGTFVAGGVNEIEHWAQEVGCVGNSSEYERCSRKLHQALSEDIRWKHVTNYFHRNALGIRSFSYNTFAATPEAAGLPEVDGPDQGWDLESELKDTCGLHNGARFGYKHSNTCMRALFTSMFITAFFTKYDAHEHTMKELHFDPARDWAEGALEEARVLLQEGVEVSSLLRIPLRRGSFTWGDGARLHFSSH